MAAISKETICNRALSLIKANATVSNLTTDTTTEAKLCREHFDESLEAVLEMHQWNFAEVQAECALSVDAPVLGYDYKHQLPTNPYCLVVRYVEDNSESEVLAYKIRGRFIESDSERVFITYTSKVDNLTETSTLFRQCLEFYLATKFAEPIMHSSDVANKMERAFYKMLRKAQKLDSQQGTYKAEEDSDYEWITARYS